jgi:NADPH-dependent 7-cyano-7-deazaguanine reductase QueF-like protein
MAGKRELIETKSDKRYVRRNPKGQFSESDDVSRSLSKDVRQHAKKVVKPGYGDKGDQKRK